MTGRPILRPNYGYDPQAPVVYLLEVAGKFHVGVRPLPDDMPSAERFGDYITARTRARELRRQNGWRICDEVSVKARLAAEEAEERRLEAKRWGAAGGQAR